MKVSILQENLKMAVGLCSKFLESKPNMPILGNLRLTTSEGGGRMAITAINFYSMTSVTVEVGCKVEIPGDITLPGKTLKDYVDRLPPERIDMVLDAKTQTVKMKCGGSKSNIKGIDAEEFPPARYVDPNFNMEASMFREMIDHVAYAAATEDNRPILTGVNMVVNDGKLSMASADGYRLAISRNDVEAPSDFYMNATILAKPLMSLVSYMDKGVVQIGFDTSRDVMTLAWGNIKASVSAIPGVFPDYMAIVPGVQCTQSVVFVADALAAVSQSIIFARDNANSLKMEFNPGNVNYPGTISIFGRSAERGDSETVVDSSVEGQPMQISLNAGYLADTLSAYNNSERVIMEMNGSGNPMVIRQVDGNDSELTVLMPMSVNK